MAELKTKITAESVSSFLAKISDETLRKDCECLVELMETTTDSKAKMWGSAIVGTGDYRYQYASGRGGDWFMMGFSPRKANISLYIMGCDPDEKREALTRLGKHKTGKGCIYVKKLSDINIDVLKELCEASYQKLKKTN
jgi:hypothetical protein